MKGTYFKGFCWFSRETPLSTSSAVLPPAGISKAQGGSTLPLSHTLSVTSVLAGSASCNLSCFPSSTDPGFTSLNSSAGGSSIHLTLLRRISKRPSKWASQQPFLDSFLGPAQFGRHGQVNMLAFWSLEIEQLEWSQWLSNSFHSLFKSWKPKVQRVLPKSYN